MLIFQISIALSKIDYFCNTRILIFEVYDRAFIKSIKVQDGEMLKKQKLRIFWKSYNELKLVNVFFCWTGIWKKLKNTICEIPDELNHQIEERRPPDKLFSNFAGRGLFMALGWYGNRIRGVTLPPARAHAWCTTTSLCLTFQFAGVGCVTQNNWMQLLFAFLGVEKRFYQLLGK